MRGERTKFFRVALVVGATALLFASVSVAAATAPSRAQLPKISSVTVSDINDRGQVVGGLTTSYAGATRGFVWKQGSLTVLGRGKFAGASGINERGQILGTSGDHEHAVLWENGTTRNVGLEF